MLIYKRFFFPQVVFKRFLSNIVNEKEISRAKDFLSSISRNSVPKHLYSLKFSRSSGPGGQNVNKVSTKVTLSLSESFLYHIPKLVLEQLVEKDFKYFNKSKKLILIQSDLTRSRESNVDDCFNKLAKEMNDIVYFRNTENDEVNQAKWKKIKQKTNEKRLQDKKRLKLKKEHRQKPQFD